ncbi:hypothetical protein BCR33DRAFT_372712 [Rhizoclosmatium globosum]|uniref:Uncharacterized protein n=1 Tax=Rhizoclosmatium globosum TaxID=329046 RepID=A0A1Y2C1N3_9FUNG|nr:hypothetical protein BCR33DRAFT_372712 [Rhizoclosmatium globosum]|eukprot:ORY40215.1 hypothetical protein BCR33DRAFT_372712 [Rhizoclosmatium globosum]
MVTASKKAIKVRRRGSSRTERTHSIGTYSRKLGESCIRVIRRKVWGGLERRAGEHFKRGSLKLTLVQRYVQNYWQRYQEKKKKVLEQALVTVGPNAQTNGMLSNLSQPISAPTPSTITTSATLAATSLNCPSCTSCAAKDEIIAGLRAQLPANPSGLVHRVPPPNGRAIVTKNPEPSFYRAYLAVKGNESSNEVFQRHAANCPEPFSDTGRVQKGQLFGMSLLISEAKVDDKTEYKRMMEDVTGEYAELKEKVNAELQRQKANHQSETLLPLSNRKYSEYHDRAVDNLQLAIDDAGK